MAPERTPLEELSEEHLVALFQYAEARHDNSLNLMRQVAYELASREGMAVTRVSELLGVSRQTIYTWLKKHAPKDENPLAERFIPPLSIPSIAPLLPWGATHDSSHPLYGWVEPERPEHEISPQLKKVMELEVILFGKIQEGPLGPRMSALEKVVDRFQPKMEQMELALFGRTQSGGLEQRLRNIDRTLYGPEMADPKRYRRLAQLLGIDIKEEHRDRS